MMLTDQQIDFVAGEIKNRGISVPDLADSLLDHLCCVIEAEMELGLNFQDAWQKAYLKVCPDDLEEVNREVQQIIIHHKHHTMKKFVFMLGFLSAFLFTVGYFFKILHWPTANLNMIIGSSLFTLGFLPMYFYMLYKMDQDKGVSQSKHRHLLNFALALTICIGIPYKILDLPGSIIIFLGNALIFSLVFLPRVFLNWYARVGKI